MTAQEIEAQLSHLDRDEQERIFQRLALESSKLSAPRKQPERRSRCPQPD